MNKFSHTEFMKVTFFWKYSKFYVYFENSRKIQENVEVFEANFVWTCSGSFYQLWQEYMWSAVDVLESGPKVSDAFKTHHTQLNLFDMNGTLA